MESYAIFLNEKYVGVIYAENYTIVTSEADEIYKILFINKNHLNENYLVAALNSNSEIVVKNNVDVYIEQRL